MPLVCLSLTARTIAEDLAVLERYRGMVDLAELRVDLLDPTEIFRVRSFPERAGLPCVLTARRAVDGGAFQDGEGVRLVTIAKALSYARKDRRANFAFVDLESDFHVPAIEEACRTFGTRVIRSRHELNGLPADLDAVWSELVAEPGEMPKLAVTPQGAAELARLVAWASGLRQRERIVIGMGEFGIASRILAERMGSYLTFTSALAAGLPQAAPGHLDPAALEGIYRFRETGRDTAVYLLGGDRTVLASKSPALHNGAFRAAGVDAIYLPVPAEDVGAFLAAADVFGARGASITVPLKESVLPYLARRSPEVEDIGACNTLVREPEGWAGYNTDASGFQRSILEFLGRKDLRGLRATILGAGGAAKAVACVVASLGGAGLVLNRTVATAKALARRHGFAWAHADERAAELVADHADLIVQTTSLGMEGAEQGDPLDWYDYTGREAVYDLVYRPERTVFLERAAMAGCRVSNGYSMLRYQAAEQFRLWTGREPPSHYFE